MSTFNYSRSQSNDIQILEDRVFDAAFLVARSDAIAVSLTGDTIKMDVYLNGSVLYSVTSGTGLTVSGATLTFNTSFPLLQKQSYDYRIYNSTDNMGISHGKLIVI